MIHPSRATVARTEEILSLDIGDLDTVFRRAHVVSKGGAIDPATGRGRLSYFRSVASARSSLRLRRLPQPRMSERNLEGTLTCIDVVPSPLPPGLRYAA
jgi:hypothetical protein